MVLSKLQVVEYFDSVINEIDLITEQGIKAQLEETSGNERVEQLLNERRQVLLSKVNEIQQHCLDQLQRQLTIEDEMNKNDKSNESDNNNEEERMKKVFTKRCFAHENLGFAYLFVVEYFVTDREVDRFRTCLKSSTAKHQPDERSQLLIEILDPRLRITDSMSGEGRIKTRVSGSVLSEDKLFNLDSPVIHVTEPLQLDISITGPLEAADSSGETNENKLVQVSEVGFEEPDQFSQTIDTLEFLVSQKVRVKELSLSGNHVDQEQFDRLRSTLQSGNELFKKVSFHSDAFDDESFWTSLPSQLNSSIDQDLFLVFVNPVSSTAEMFEWLGHWTQLQSLILLWCDLEEEQLSREHFSYLSPTLHSLSMALPAHVDADAFCDLHSLRFLNIEVNDQEDWSFLDSIRGRLEKLRVDTILVPSCVLRNMPKLKELEIDDYSGQVPIEIEYDSDEDMNADLFTGLESLEKLDISSLNSKQLVNDPRHFVHLSSLQQLSISVLDYEQASLITMFSRTAQDSSPSRPQLFGSLRTLKLFCTTLNDLCPRPFSGLTQLTTLDLWCGEESNEHVTQELFYGLDSLTHLKLSAKEKFTLDPDAFAHLDKLVDIDLGRTELTFEELKASGLFDQCKSVKYIGARGGAESPKAVYFDKLDRFVWVKE